jgi:putative transcriptional regulator
MTKLPDFSGSNFHGTTSVHANDVMAVTRDHSRGRRQSVDDAEGSRERQSVNAIETGKFDPSLTLAFKLARLFEMPIEAIFSDEG